MQLGKKEGTERIDPSASYFLLTTGHHEIHVEVDHLRVTGLHVQSKVVFLKNFQIMCINERSDLTILFKSMTDKSYENIYFHVTANN